MFASIHPPLDGEGRWGALSLECVCVEGGEGGGAFCVALAHFRFGKVVPAAAILSI